ncbi:hypothetical protein VTL71DRAFT_2646 [Oculimacula yallundae]|uniref:Apple domain-containing protein n=1 Tax=Oculimacula yallundae TaxID=86028 RepID=A0ABR4C9I4_9HELO
MKFFAISLLAGLASSSVISVRDENPLCNTPVTRGDTSRPENGGPSPFATIPGKGRLAECRALCYSSQYAQCRSFAVREHATAGGCSLYDTDITSKIIPKTTTNVVYAPLPAGIVGWVPENAAKHYYANTDKKHGNYVDCRKLCLDDPVCKGFGYKEKGNCQLYDVSLVGKVKADATSPYVQWQMDCRA